MGRLDLARTQRPPERVFPRQRSEPQPSPEDGLGATDTKPIVKHGLAYAIALLRHVLKSICQDVYRALVGQQQSASEIVRLRLDSAVSNTLASLIQRRTVGVAEQAVRQFVTDIAPLPMRMMGVVVYNGDLGTTRHCHR